MKVFRILAVDDDPHQLASLRRILRRSQYVVETAGSGRAALRMAVKNPPDLVLIDISMPNMSGMEFLRRLRRLEAQGLVCSANPRPPAAVQPIPIPVIFLTGLQSPHHCVASIDAGAADHLTKPFDADELRARVRSQLRQTEERRRDLESMAVFLCQSE